MFPEMEFSEHLLNEPYILSPYKLCVANFLLSYIEQKNAAESAASNTLEDSGKRPPKPPNPLSHCYLGFRLIMSLDCSYAELRSQLVAPIEVGSRPGLGRRDPVREKIDAKVLERFDQYLVDIRMSGLNKLYDFVRRVHKVLAKKPGAGLNTSRHHHSISGSEELSRIHRLSMAGLFLRKFVIHFERLVFSEVAILYNQLERYLKGETDYDYLPVQPVNPILAKFHSKKTEEFTPAAKKSGKAPLETPRSVKQPNEIELTAEEMSKLERLESKLAECSKDSELVRHLRSMASEVRQCLPVKQNPIRSSMLPYGELNTSSSDELEIPPSPCSSSSSAMSLDDFTLNETSKTPTEEWKEFKLKKKEHKIKKQLRKTLEIEPGQTVSDFAKLHSQQASQHFLLKQVYKILINEHAALSPPAIVEFINYYFEQHNRFHYNQFIQLNYKANLNLAARAAGAEANGSNGQGTNGSGAGGSGTGLVPSKTKDLFQSINYQSDIYYLKFINALRVNNYTAAQEAFYMYFDLKKPTRLTGNSGGAFSSVAGTSHALTNGPVAANGANAANPNDPPKAGTVLNSSGSNFCWAALNLAIMYAHFRHYRRAYEALTDCISAAREKRDERCLQFAMIWLLLVLQQFNTAGSGGDEGSAGAGQTAWSGTSVNFRGASSSSATANRSAQSRAAELSHRNHKGYNDLNLIQNLVNLIALNEYSLPYIAAMAYLHLEKQIYLRPIFTSLLDQQLVAPSVGGTKQSNAPRRPPLAAKPLILAVRYQMDDILMKSYASHAAVLNAYGAVHLAAVMSNELAKLNLVDMVDQELIAHVSDSQAIAARNQAFYAWAIRGDYGRAMELLSSFGKYYSSYNNSIRLVVEQAKAEIRFEKHLFAGEWAQAMRCVNLVRITNRTQALMMLAELRRRQNEPIGALEAIDLILTPSGPNKSATAGGGSKNTRIPFVGATFSGGTQGFFRNANASDLPSPINGSTGVGGGGFDEEDSVVIGDEAEELDKMSAKLATPKNLRNFVTPRGRGARGKNAARLSVATVGSIANTKGGTPSTPSGRLKSSSASIKLPAALEPEEERALTLESDPYAWISCHVMKATILGDLSGLLDCVVKSQAHGFRVLETRALLEIARIQQNLFGQCVESQQILNSLMVRLVANGALKDLALAYFLTATNHFYLHQKEVKRVLLELPLRFQTGNDSSPFTWTPLDAATWANERSIVIWKRIGEKTALLESLHLQAFIENERGNREQRNFYAKQAKLVRAELL